MRIMQLPPEQFFIHLKLICMPLMSAFFLQTLLPSICWLMIATIRTTATASLSTLPPTPLLFPLRTLCLPNPCQNGNCYVAGGEPRCLCGEFFKGDRCQHVNMSAVRFTAIGNVAILQWPRPPRLHGYSFVYFKLPSVTDQDQLTTTEKHHQPPQQEQQSAVAIRIDMKNNERSLLVSQLMDGRTRYRLCIEDDESAERAVDGRTADALQNCIDIETEADYHSLVGWFLAVVFSFVAVLLIYLQKDKIELLYFHKPMPGYYSTPLSCEKEETYSVHS